MAAMGPHRNMQAKLPVALPQAIVMGIDPGTNHTGYGVIGVCGDKMALVAQGRFSPNGSWDLARRLAYIYQGLYDVASANRPASVAVEDIFYGPNVRSALKLGHVRGVALVAAAQVGAAVYAYAPRLVKSSVAGYGQANKNQVAHMVKELLKLPEPLTVDAADALAVAICHVGQSRLNNLISPLATRRQTATSWRNISPEDIVALNFRPVEK
ncbi:MAG: crossover junction endodeoxyribonuclease RuvC, partial [Candidatus Adiutrix sp.]